MDLEKVRELIRILEASNLAEMEVEVDGHRVRLRKPQRELVASPPTIVTVPAGNPAAGSAEAAASEDAQGDGLTLEDGLVTIDSPMVGVFYEAPAPGDAPFARPGDEIEEDQTVCIVEAMKLMNEVAAKFKAIVETVLVKNGEPVEFGQPLFTVRPLE